MTTTPRLGGSRGFSEEVRLPGVFKGGQLYRSNPKGRKSPWWQGQEQNQKEAKLDEPRGAARERGSLPRQRQAPRLWLKLKSRQTSKLIPDVKRDNCPGNPAPGTAPCPNSALGGPSHSTPQPRFQITGHLWINVFILNKIWIKPKFVEIWALLKKSYNPVSHDILHSSKYLLTTLSD